MLKQQGQQNLVNILLNNTIHLFFFQCGNTKIIPISLIHIILHNGK